MKIVLPTKIEEMAFEEATRQMEHTLSALSRLYDDERHKLIRKVMQKHNCTEEAARKAIEQMEDIYYGVLIGEKK